MFDVRSKIVVNSVPVQHTSWHCCASVELLMQKGDGFWTLNDPEWRDLVSTGAAHTVARLQEIWTTETRATSPVRADVSLPQERMAANLIQFVLDHVQDASPAALFHGAMPVVDFRQSFFDTIMQADDADVRTVHMCIVTAENGHSAVVAWQLSESYNKMLLERELTDAAQNAIHDVDDDDDGGVDDDATADDSSSGNAPRPR